MSIIRSIIQYPTSRSKRPYSVPVTDNNGLLIDDIMPTSVQDADDKAHIQNTDTKLDEGGSNEISASEINDQLYADQETGTEIAFAHPQIYNTPDSPGTGDITADVTDAVLGVIQKVYHNDSSEPNFPDDWVLLSGAYSTDELNIIMAEYVSDTRIEYWITHIYPISLESEVITYRVGPSSNADYETINQALEDITTRHYPIYRQSGTRVDIILEDDFVMDEQVLVKDIDLGWIYIIQESAQTSYNITNIESGTEVQSEQAGITECEITTFDNDATDIHGNYVTFTTVQNTHKFYFEVSGEDEIDISDEDNAYIISIDSTSTESEVASALQNEVDNIEEDYGSGNESAFSTSLSDSILTVENTESGDVSDSSSDSKYVNLNVEQQGQDQWNQTKIIVDSSHGYSDGDEITIKNHYGSVEEEYYNGLWTITNTSSDSFELDYSEHGIEALYDEDRAGSGDTGNTSKVVEIEVNRSACTENFEHFYYPAFGVARGTLPTIGCVFKMNKTSNGNSGYMSYIDGICGAERALINMLPYSGFRNADGSNIYATRGSIINANDVLADGAGRHGVWAYSNTQINARRVFVNDCGWQGTDSDRGDGWDEERRPVGCAFLSTRGSVINAEGSNALESQGDCVCAYYGGVINVGNHEEQGILAGGSKNGLTFNSPGGTISGIGKHGRDTQIDDNIVNRTEYDKIHPGPKTLIAGNWNAGFFGTVKASELFSGKEPEDASWLINELDITQGITIFEDVEWLKFAWRDKVQFIPRLSIRRSISWDHLYLKGCVYGTGDEVTDYEQYMLDNAEAEDEQTYKDWVHDQTGLYRIPQTAQVTLNGIDYKVRLIKGVHDHLPEENYGRGNNGIDKEWDRLILPLYFQVEDYDWRRTIDGDSDYSDYVNTIVPNWGVYYDDSEDGLGTHHDEVYGSRPWCQEFSENPDPSRRVSRGYFGAPYLYAHNSWLTFSSLGFRPVLEPL